MTELLPHTVYHIELCSGEQRRWRSLGAGAGGAAWWRDEETGLEFNEGGLLYAWHVVAAEDAAPPGDR